MSCSCYRWDIFTFTEVFDVFEPLFSGLPLGLLPSMWPSGRILWYRLLSILLIWPRYCIFLALTIYVRSLWYWSRSLIFVFCILSFLVTPNIFLKQAISNTLNLCASIFFNVQVSAPYMAIDNARTRYSSSLVEYFMSFDFHIGFSFCM